MTHDVFAGRSKHPESHSPDCGPSGGPSTGTSREPGAEQADRRGAEPEFSRHIGVDFRARPSESCDDTPHAVASEQGTPAGLAKAAVGLTWGAICSDDIRRSLDIAVSSSVLVLSAPLMLIIAILVRLDSPGPAIFRHHRIGINRRRTDARPPYSGPERRTRQGYGKPFALYKFRTMYTDARERFPELYAYNYSDEELYTLPIKILVGPRDRGEPGDSQIEVGSESYADPRVTRVGRWLRRTSLDEIPNFVNVLKGDMHLVGPRPDMEDNIHYYAPHQLRKFDVKPGITGLAQIRGRGKLTFHQTNEFDLEYVERRSLRMDIMILLRTIGVLSRREGAY